ncbi:Uncharacterised protein [Burkholderia pseudomallei]|nr:Uncharacterised protein [Burkholderia pseudomallei]CAJ3643383.1 Uncharacterised protein [Burkholderia pseudomallei]
MRRNRAAIDRDERARAARGMLMDRGRGEFLAGACLAGHEHGRVGARDPAHRVEQLQHRVARADHPLIGGRDRRRARREQAFHPVRVTHRIRDPLMRRGQRDVVEAVIAQQRAHVRHVRLLRFDERDPRDVAQRRAYGRHRVHLVDRHGAQIENAARDLARRRAHLVRARDDGDLPVAAREFLAQQRRRLMRPVNQRSLSDRSPGGPPDDRASRHWRLRS